MPTAADVISQINELHNVTYQLSLEEASKLARDECLKISFSITRYTKKKREESQ